MSDARRLAGLSDADLSAALRELATSLDVPVVPAVGREDDPARRARLAIEAAGLRPPRQRLIDRLGLSWPSAQPVRRGLVLAVAAVLALAAIAGAIGFGLPGLRILFGPAATASPILSGSPGPSQTATASPTATPSPSPAGPPGSSLQLGRQVTLAEAGAQAGFPILLPTDPSLGLPSTVWIDDVGRVSLVWAAGPGLPATLDPGVGLIVTELPGTVRPEYFQKVIRTGTTIEPVTVSGTTGYWISGAPHEFVFVDRFGNAVFDTRRMVGDTLAWSSGDVTYRIESGLGKDTSIRLLEGLR